MIKINTSGDYVQLIYVDAVGQSVQQELKSNTDAFECSYDSEGKLYMQFGLMRFENPDPTDFTINGSAVTDAADFISKLNALFTGGGGGGGWGTTGTIATLTGDGTVDLNGNDFTLMGPTTSRYYFDPSIPYMQNMVSDGVGFSSLSLYGDSGDDYSSILQSNNGANNIIIQLDPVVNSATYTAGNHVFVGLGDYMDDAAAASGGVPVNGLYHTAGAVKIRLS